MDHLLYPVSFHSWLMLALTTNPPTPNGDWAKQLGITVPPALLGQADEVIE